MMCQHYIMMDFSYLKKNQLERTNSHLFYSYNIILFLFEQFGVVIKYRKSEVFHFSRLHGPFNPPSLDFSYIGGPILQPKDTWQYLGFILERKLLF